jgi:hypothetical protein
MTPFIRGTKGPVRRSWGVREKCVVPEDWVGNFGLVHGYSGTCAIDIDNIEKAREILDIDALMSAPDAVWIIGNPANHAKLLYRLPSPMVSVKWREENRDVLNFRCMPADMGLGPRGCSVQDVLPPSLHPDTGGLYQWGGAGDHRQLPLIPLSVAALWAEKLRVDRPADGAGRGVVDPEARRLETDVDELTAALRALDPDVDRELWVRVGFAFQAGGGEYEDWDAWSAGATEAGKYAGPDDTRKTWVSFKGDGGVGPATLYGMALAAGWRPAIRWGFEDAGPAPRVDCGAGAPGGGGAEGGTGALGQTVTAASRTTDEKAADAALIAQLSRDAEGAANVERVIGELCRVARSIVELDLLQKVVADRSGVSIKTIRDQFSAELKRNERKPGSAVNRYAATLEGRFERISGILANEPAADPRDFPSLAGRYVYIQDCGMFYDRLRCKLVKREALDMMYSHLKWDVCRNEAAAGEDGEYEVDGDGAPPPPSTALTLSTVSAKVEGMDYWPGVRTAVFQEEGVLVLNSWKDDGLKPVEGDITMWLNHLEWLVPDPAQRKILLQWMAFCLKHQDQKINYGVLMLGVPRTGKDWLMLALKLALGRTNTGTFAPDRLAEPYEDFLVGKKLIILNELHFSGMSHSKLENKLKPYLAAPPERLSMRRIGIGDADQRNIVQLVAFTNYRAAMTLATSAERWFCVDTAPEEAKDVDYYTRAYNWMLHEGGAASVAFHLLNKVDLSDFCHTSSAPTTAWRETLEAMSAGTDALTSSVSEMIEDQAGPFYRDLVRIQDVVNSLRHMLAGQDVRVNSSTVRRALVSCSCVQSKEISLRVKSDDEKEKVKKIQLWAVRDVKKWAGEKKNSVWIEKFEQENGIKISAQAAVSNVVPFPR